MKNGRLGIKKLVGLRARIALCLDLFWVRRFFRVLRKRFSVFRRKKGFLGGFSQHDFVTTLGASVLEIVTPAQL